VHVLATAGHVDHGKSTLVRALTGMEPDRWAEERRRGMTIDLGYAWTNLPSGELVAFVDVPGHQRFIANMLAGIGPAPAVLFVVGADEGWSRQSEEHLAAIDALELRYGVLAVTRSDLADPAPAVAEARERIARSSLGHIEAVPVSGVTGAGVAELRLALDRLVALLPNPDRDARVRLWIDRSFTIRGSGTVVTGTLSAGTVSVGDALELRGQTVTVRGLETTGNSQPRVGAVARIALNLRGLGRSQIGRGDVLLTPRAWHLTTTLDARLDAAQRVPAELMLHVGTAAVAVRVRPLGGPYARLTWARPLPIQAGDRGVLRDPGRRHVAAGVLVVDSDPPPFARRGAAADRARQLAAVVGERPDVSSEVGRRGAVQRAHLARLGFPTNDGPGVRALGDWLIADKTWENWITGVQRLAAEWAGRNPLDPGIPIAVVQQALRIPEDHQIMGAVVFEAGLISSAGRVSRRDAVSDLTRATGLHTLVERLEAAPFAAPERGELDALGLGGRELAAGEKAGVLTRISADIVLLPTAPSAAATILSELPQPFTTSAARQALGTTRRVVIPLLEYLDVHGLTERVDSSRRLVVAPADE
jgi:selenocysteine-specific elongation factor